MTPDPNTNAHVAGSWLASMAGWAYSVWHWFAGDASGMTIFVGIGTIIITAIKIAQEVSAWRGHDEERQVLRKLWARMRSRPGALDSRWEESRHGL